MSIRDYLDQQAEALAQSGRRIRDYRVFDFNYVPLQPLMREEAKTIIDACLRYWRSGIPNHLFIFGSRGCGKTLIARYIGQLLTEKQQVKVLYVNCRQHNTSFKILAHLLNIRPRGCGLDELWLRFCQRFSDKLILVLDEVDLLSDKDARRDLLYLISRSALNPMVILLSNHPKFLSTVDESIRSTLQPEMVHFRNYDAVQIQQILGERAQTGLRNFDAGQLAHIAAMTTQMTNSDVRVAIKTLYYMAMEPNADVENLFHRARRDLIAEVLADLNERNLLILKAITQTPEPFVKVVYARYRQMSAAEHQEPFSYVHFYTSLAYLQSIGLILLIATKTGRAYTNRVDLLFTRETLDICGERQ